MTNLTVIKVLVDRNIEVDQSIAVPATKTSKIKWGDIELEHDLPGYLQKNYSKTDHDKMAQISCLPSIKKAVDDGRAELYSYIEIGFERLQASFPNGMLFGDILGNNFKEIEPAINRSFFQSYDFFELGVRQPMIDFCLFLIENKLENIETSQFKQMGLSDFQINNIFNLNRFREICKNISSAPTEHPKLCDAFHLWTAEVNNMNYFLTRDTKFINKVTESSKIQFKCIPITPANLLKKLGIEKKEPLPLEKDKFYHMYLCPPFKE